MIIKGKSRGGPKQLATYLLRADTRERVELLELQSSAGTLAEAFQEWQLIAEGTQGRRGLYHAFISPHARYPMDTDQWQRAVTILDSDHGFFIIDGVRSGEVIALRHPYEKQQLHLPDFNATPAMTTERRFVVFG